MVQILGFGTILSVPVCHNHYEPGTYRIILQSDLLE